MAKAAKKKAKSAKKSARVTAKPKAAARSAKPAKKKTAKLSRPAARKTAAPKIDPLNRKHYGALTPMLAVRDVRKAVDFYTKAFGFSVRGIMDSPQGAIHAELRLRDTTLMLSPESPQQGNLTANSIGNTPATLYALVENVDGTFNSAVAAGGKVLMPVTDMFWGDRCAMVGDPDGNKWMIATHKAEPTEAEMAEAMRRMQAPQGGEAAAASAGGESEY
jgi:PhnB protein